MLKGFHFTFVDAARNDMLFRVFDRFSHGIIPPDVNALFSWKQVFEGGVPVLCMVIKKSENGHILIRHGLLQGQFL